MTQTMLKSGSKKEFSRWQEVTITQDDWNMIDNQQRGMEDR